MRYWIGAALAAAFLLAGNGQAAAVHDVMSFSISDFEHIDGSTLDAPYLPLTGQFTLDFDNSASITQSTPITISGFNFPFSGFGPIGFTYDQSQDMIILGTHVFSNGCQIGVGDFCAFIWPVSQQRGSWDGSFLIGLPYAGTPFLDAYDAGEVEFLNAAPPPAPVPEPASWALMIAGFGAVGGALRMRRRTPQPA